MEEKKKIITANKDNDLKYSMGIDLCHSSNQEISESAGDDQENDKVEYFTE